MRRELALCLVGVFVGAPARAQPPDPQLVVRGGGGEHLPPRWPRRPLLDAASEAAGIATIRDAEGRDGEGATICVVDTGIDLTHRDFRDRDGRTRVAWLFDFGRAPRGVHRALEERFECAVWRGDELDEEVDVPGDENGHGTAVASVAAGDDADVGEDAGPLAGAAPRAGLTIVKLPLEGGLGFTDELIARGTEACFSLPESERTVAVLAFGGHDGRHDGTEPLDVALSALAEMGARIVVAAGNDGDRPIHATGTLGSRATARVALSIPRAEPEADGRFVSLAITALSSARVSVTGPDGVTVGPTSLGERAESAEPGGRLVVDGTLSADARRGAIYVVVGGGEDREIGGEYEVAIETSGRFDAWIVDHDLGDALLGPRLRGPFAEASGTVTVPGTAQGVITVGATNTYTSTLTARGEVGVGGAPGEVAPFSSVGPSPDGRAKPDLVAPGALVVAALSTDVVDGDPANLFRGATGRVAFRRIAPDRIALSGTSFTAPLAAGVLALELGDEPRADDLDRLRFTARPDGEAWTARAGFGHLDAAAFLSGAAPTSGVSLNATAPIDLASPRLFVAGRVAPDGEPYTGSVELLLDGVLHDRIEARSGLVASFVSPPPLYAGETTTLEARLDGALAGEVVVRGRIDGARERFTPNVGGAGGCGATGGRPVGALVFFLALLFSRGTRLRSRGARRRGASGRPCRGCRAAR